MARSWKSLLVYRIMDQDMRRCARLYLRGRLLDIGCGTKPYAAILREHVTEHVGVDRESPFDATARPELVGTAYSIPTPDASFDSAISTAALEHLDEPELALRETQRVLKPGGIAVYTVPFIWHVHAEPWDYFRYTSHGLRHLFEKTGFEVVELYPLAGFWTTFITLFCYWLDRINVRPLRWMKIIPLFGVTLQMAGMAIHRFERSFQWTWMHTIVARRK